MDAAERGRAGRKRSETSRRAILDAAIELLRERGYSNVTADGIAAAAGVGKQTIYRWWGSVKEVLLDALRENARAIPIPDEGSLEGDLEAFLGASFRLLQGPRGTGPILKGLMADAQLDPAFLPLFMTFIDERRAVLRGLLERRGERPPGEIDAMVDMLFGAMWYRLLLGHGKLNAVFASALARHASRSLAPPA